jgi:hypothetical protein
MKRELRLPQGLAPLRQELRLRALRALQGQPLRAPQRQAFSQALFLFFSERKQEWTQRRQGQRGQRHEEKAFS